MKIKLTLLFTLLCFSIQTFAQETPLWLRYSSISPDGEKIVFSYQGDLFTVDSEGGEATPLTSHVAYDYTPVWSPDGKWIAFASDRYGNFDIFIIPAEGGSAKRLSYFSGNETPNSFTPDGKYVLFSANIQDDPKNMQFPSGVLTELYKIPAEGGELERVLTTPAEKAVMSADGAFIYYQDRKGYEDEWRKHHTSSVTRDLWRYDIANKKHEKITSYEGEDRNPVIAPDGETIYYLTEEFNNDFNVGSFSLNDPSNKKQITNYSKHPVRFLSISNEGLLCYGFNGEIYTQTPGQEASKLSVTIKNDNKINPVEYKTESNGAREMDVSPDGEEIAFILRGEVFVSSVDFSTTKRITNTPEQERSVSFSPDGKALLYASERNGSWNLYQTKIVREEEKNFALSTILEEEAILEIPEESFQPAWSPDGKEVAYLQERTTLKVINLETKEIRTILPGDLNYSYSDGDQWYQWSPDGKWFLAQFSPNQLFSNDIALVDATGKQKIVNLTNSGYNDGRAKWMMKGNMMLWFSDRQGLKSHGSWGFQSDVYGMFLNQESFDKFNMTKEEREIYGNEKKDNGENGNDDDDKKGKDKNGDEKIEEISIELDKLEDREVRLTIHSSSLSDAVMTPDGKKLYYLSRFEKGYDLWMHDLVENKTKLVSKLNSRGGSLHIDKKGKNLFVFAGNSIFKIDTKAHKKKNISFKAAYYLDKQDENDYLFEHVWRQVKKKFYVKDLHGVDWEFYKKEYERFLPHINNNHDFAEMLSEMLGELNASHTGSGYRNRMPNGDNTASLAAFYDFNYEGEGVKILEIIEKSPLIQADSKIKSGHIIEKVNGEKVNGINDLFKLLNHKTSEYTLLSIYDPNSDDRWEETLKPVSRGQESQLLYERWVKTMRQETERLSDGKLGYVHVRGMNDQSFRMVYKDLFGRNYKKEGIVIDTRFNGGGWLHDDLAVLFSGEKYVDYVPRGQHYGHDPMARWTKKSILLMSESNYSDAHGFPYAYTTLDIGKTVGMPVPGTMTAVWWETLQDRSLYFGIPQVGSKDMNGNYLENKQLEPDIKVRQDYDVVSKGRDQQLEKAVEVLIEEL